MSDERLAKIVVIDEERLAHVGTLMLKLTKRQRSVLNQIANGLTTKDIAEHLVISPRTVEFHIKCIRARFDLPLSAITVYVAVAERLLT